MKRPDPAADRALARSIARWFRASARDLPWRTSPRDPYRSLVSEFMLQQTQVSRVLEKFGPFIERFPDIRRLARAKESAVLAMWSGMGYYRRARNLHAAVRVIQRDFGGEVPGDTGTLATLPGVGRYTAGAISSIVFGNPDPIVDGNIARVLMRLDGKPFRHGSPEALNWAWRRAERLIAASKVSPAALNEGLMELGATVCTPRAPDCQACPARPFCAAARRGLQDRIPLPKSAPQRSRLFSDVVVVRDVRGRILMEQRPPQGMWPGLWQAPTLERMDRAARPSEVAGWIGRSPVVRRDSFVVNTTHREVHFAVWTARGIRRPGGARSFLPVNRIAALSLSSPQRRILLGAADPTPETRRV